MRIKKLIISTVALAALVTASAEVSAQNSSINTYSPYTFYGLGDLATQGPAYMRSMGGTGVAFHSPIMVNYLNPASNGYVGQRSFLFNFGLEGSNHYLKSENGGATRKTSFNTFNVRDIALQFPVAKNMGVSVSVTPYSEVGYRIEKKEDNEEIINSLGLVKYTYQGEGGITQFKAGFGMKVVNNLSLGAEMIYYHGSIERSYGMSITPILTGGNYNGLTATNTESISRIRFGFGAQYDAIATQKRLLTLGATYKAGGNLNAKHTSYVPSGNIFGDTVSITKLPSGFKLPNSLTLGAFYHTPRLSVGADYTFEDWSRNESEQQKVRYVDTHAISVGGQYTPNRGDIRRFYNRLTYRLGFRYSDYYMQIDGNDVSTKAITMGVGIPVRMAGTSNINVGLELGQRGKVAAGQIRENYFKVSVGLSLFGEDYWFMKKKFD